MVSVLAFISGVIRAGASLTGPTGSWAATKTGNTNGIAASSRFIGFSVLGSNPRVGDRRRERPDSGLKTMEPIYTGGKDIQHDGRDYSAEVAIRFRPDRGATGVGYSS